MRAPPARKKPMTTDAEKMQAIFTQVEKVADTDSNVLIYGESGTGKELIARQGHSVLDRVVDRTHQWGDKAF